MLGRLEALGKLKVGCPGGVCLSCPPGAWRRRGRAWPLETVKMKVTEHGPTLPPTEEADATAVNTAA